MESEHFKTIENINALYAEDIEKLKAQIVDPKELEATIVLKDQAVRNEHEARQESNALKEELRIRDAQIKQVNDRLNNLAGLLEEYITAYESDLSFYETLVKKNQHVKQGLRQKIENYNKGE
jgi:DNA repair ATPase RecN